MRITDRLVDYAHALGRYDAVWRFARPVLRHSVAISLISQAWDVFRRDAGAGQVGRDHSRADAEMTLTATNDRRRDAMLLWLADYGKPPIAEAAALLAKAIDAKRRFDENEYAMLDAARDALNAPPAGRGPIAQVLAAEASMPQLLGNLAAAVDRLRCNTEFSEAPGSEVRLSFPTGTHRHYVPADPGGAWALNLALLTPAFPIGGLPVPGLVSRALFRMDLEPAELASILSVGAATALTAAYETFERIEGCLCRGQAALDHLSRNARAPEAWALVAALGSLSRTQLSRAIGLSRAGADIQAHTLASAGLVKLERGGSIIQEPERSSLVTEPLDQDALQGAISAVDESLAEIDRLLAGKTPR